MGAAMRAGREWRLLDPCCAYEYYINVLPRYLILQCLSNTAIHAMERAAINNTFSHTANSNHQIATTELQIAMAMAMVVPVVVLVLMVLVVVVIWQPAYHLKIHPPSLSLEALEQWHRIRM